MRSADYGEGAVKQDSKSTLKTLGRPSPKKKRKEKGENVVVMPYIHRVSHGLKNWAKMFDVEGVSFAPKRRSGLCSATDPGNRDRHVCGKKHRKAYVSCATGVI